jgi:PII-like signaling protein
LLWVFIGGRDRADRRLLHAIIVSESRKHGIAGVTVLRELLGFGANGRIHISKILRLFEGSPLVVEIIDAEEKIEAFLPELDKIIGGVLVTLEKI